MFENQNKLEEDGVKIKITRIFKPQTDYLKEKTPTNETVLPKEQFDHPIPQKPIKHKIPQKPIQQSVILKQEVRVEKKEKNKPIKQSENKKAKPKRKGFSFSFGGLSMKEQIFFAKRLSFLIRANVPVLESLQMIREQTGSKRYAKILDVIIEDVSSGQYLSTSLKKFKHVFSEFAINIISIGESTGVLSENLEYLAEELKKKQELRRKVIGAFVYPVIVTVATLGITSFLMIYLFPKITPVFTSLHVTLPLSTRIVIFVSNFLRSHGLAFILFIIAVILAFIFLYRKNEKFHILFDEVLLRLPLIGPMIQYFNLANCSRTMGLLLKSGLTSSEALPITAKTTVNHAYRREFNSLVHVVDRGEKMSVYLREHKQLFPEMFGQIIAVGEKSGNLSNSLMYISDLYESEVDDFTKNLSSLIEPVLMIFMGLLVGFIAISIITPIYGITQNLHP